MAVDAIMRRIQRDAAQERMRTAGITRKRVEADLRKTTIPPRALEISYSGFLVGTQRKINAAIREQLKATRSILDLARQDAFTDDITRAFGAIRGTVDKLSGAVGGAFEVGIGKFGSQTAGFNAAKYDSPTMNLLGIGNSSADVERRIVQGWVTENTQLIRNMNLEQLGKLETLFLRALRDGSRASQVQADVTSILGGSERRARLIARDQIGKLNGQLDRQKQTESGLDSYVWRGVGDARERPSHVAREGQVFRWDQPPPDGHPGQPVQCRCSPEPNLESLLGAEFAPAPVTPEFKAATTAEKRRENARKVAAKRRRARRRPVQVAQ